MRFKNFHIVIYYDIFRNKNYCSQTPNLIFLGSEIPVLTPRQSDGPQESQKNSGIFRFIINKSHFYKWRHQKNLENLWKFISQERHIRILIWSFYENRYYEFSRKGTKMILYSSTKFRWWKVFAKIEETSQFWNLKVSSFKFSNPDSLELKWNFIAVLLQAKYTVKI